ncbi:hypothetical protein [Ktedonobacter racemifer]|uniref:Uncharacterized protein n=1 Tax=Ktedonobacter racemifer DSM 44963 TaxID=485913 RepID=D6TYU2_KTERA|nr:hypothetical protein [Ktedonobacter racemifer]EFH85167.1 hypothetical protein Krac_6335 [Ktedonobacter racemifer DSM 44963]
MDNHSFDQPLTQRDELPPDLQTVVNSYAAQPVPRPSSTETARLIHTLLTEAAFQAQDTHKEGTPHLWRIAVLTRWRVYLLGPWFWMASVLLLLAGIGLSRSLSVSDLITLLILLLPLAAVFGLTHALHAPSAGLRAVEASCPVTFVQTSMSLGLVLLVFDSLLGLVATLGFALAHFAPFWNLLLAWLAPLLLLTAISLPIALLCNVRLAALIGGLPWMLLGLLALAEQNGPGIVKPFFSLPQDTLSLASHLATIALGLLLLIVFTTFAPKWQRFCAF